MHVDIEPQRIQKQQQLYLSYALAAEAYSKKPNYTNWHEKEKALEKFNAFVQKNRRNDS